MVKRPDHDLRIVSGRIALGRCLRRGFGFGEAG
jgi:hypothetical protein